MSKSISILLVCPACKSRRQVPRELIGQRVRCRQCTAELTVDAPATEDEDLLLADEPPPSAAAAVQPPPTAAVPAYTKSHAAAISEDDIPIAPLPSPPVSKPAKPVSQPTKPLAQPPQAISPAEAEAGAAVIPPIKIDTNRRKPPSAASSPHDTWIKPPAKKTLAWTFLSGIFFYFLRPNALPQWLMLSVGLLISWWLLSMGAFALGGMMFGGVAAGCFAISGFLIGIAAYSYASACFLSIIENTAYHLDKEDRWPDPEFRDWVFQFLRLIYLGVLCSVLAAPLGYVVSLSDTTLGGWVASIASDLLFPILLLSMLETTSTFWPYSPPILRSLVGDWRAWLAFYAVTIVMTTVVFFTAVLIYDRLPITPWLLIAPLTAAVWFGYGRLIGRLASYIMHLEEKERVAREP